MMPRNKKRRRGLGMTSFPMQRSLLLLLLLVLAGTTNTVQAAMYDECKKHLTAADADANGSLSPTEFSDAIQRITYGAVTSLSTFVLPSNTLVLSNTEAVDTTCANLYPALVAALNLPLPGGVMKTSQCFLYMTIGDGNRNGLLERDSEYPRYLAAWSQKLDLGAQPTTYEALTTPLQVVFDEFAQSGATSAIDVTGTRPSTQPTAVRLPIMTSLCHQTVVALAAADHVLRTTTPTTTVVPPNTSDGGSSSSLSSTDLRFCQTAMLAADRDRNLALDDTEFVRFVSTLARRVVVDDIAAVATALAPDALYDTLPTELQTVFATHAAAVGTIAFVRPGDPTVTADQQARIQSVCDDTANALLTWANSNHNNSNNNDGDGSPSPNPDTPTDMSPPVEAYPYTQCTLSMVTSDRDRSNTLDATEYVSFVNKVESNAWRDVKSLDNLPPTLQTNFQTLASANSNTGAGGGIDITGSFPSSPPTPEQRTFLERICWDTAVAAHAALYPTIDDKNGNGNTNSSNTTTTITTFTGNVTIYTAFVIIATSTEIVATKMTTDNNETEIFLGNNNVTLVDVMAQNDTQETLQDAYEQFILQKIALYQGAGDYRVWDDTVSLYSFQSYTMGDDCTDCQVVYGQLDVEVKQYPGEVEWVTGNLTAALQTSLNATTAAGSLQSFLVLGFSPNPSPLTIVGIPVDGQVKPTTDIVDEVQSKSSDDDKGRIGAGLVVGIILIILVLCCCGTAWYFFGDLPDKIMAARKENQANAADGDQGGDGYSGPKFTGAPSGYDDDDDDAPPPAPVRKPRRASIFMHGHPDDSEQGGGGNDDFGTNRPEQPADDDGDDEYDDPFPKRAPRKMSYGGDDDDDDDAIDEGSASGSASGSGYGDSDSGGSYDDDYGNNGYG